MHSHQLFLAARFTFVLFCVIGAFTHCFIISSNYFSYPVRDEVSPFAPLELTLPKFTLCFALDTLLTNQPSKFFFYENDSAFNRTLGYLKNITPPVEQVMSGCAYRDWLTDSVMVERPSECLKYFDVKKMVIQRYICYKFSPARVNYSFFDAISSLERRRMLYRISISPPLNAGHRILPMVHTNDLSFHEQLYAQEILPSTEQNELYLVSYSTFIYSALPPPYTTQCKVASQRVCYLDCAAKLHSKSGLTQYSTIFIENDSLRIPNVSSPSVVKLLRHLDDEIRTTCSKKCVRTQACELIIAVTSTYLSFCSMNKMTFEVQTLKEPAIRIQKKARIDFIDYFTQFTSVCSFWLGFCVLKSLQGHRTQSPQCIKLLCLKLVHIESHMHQLITELNRKKYDVTLFMEKRAAFMKRKNRFIMVISLFVKAAALIGFSSQLYCVLEKHLLYETKMTIKFDLNPLVSAPNINLCLPMTLFLTGSYVGLFSRKNFEQSFSTFDREIFGNRSLSELMRIMPPTHRLINGCRLRSNDSDFFSELEVRMMPECMNSFSSERFFMNHQVCYSFKPIVQPAVKRQSRRSLTISHHGVFYSLILNKKSLKMILEVYLTEEQYPEISRHFSDTIRRPGCYVLSTFKRTARLLPPPYETNCHPSRDRAECTERCVTKRSLAEFGLINSKGIVTERILNNYTHSRPVRFSDWSNEKTGKMLRSIEHQCQNTCFKPKCVSVITKTFKSHPFRSDFSHEVAVGLRASPDQEAQAEPRTDIFSLYYQVACSANFWLGFVFLSFCLFQLKSTRVREKMIALLNHRIELIKCFLCYLVKFTDQKNEPAASFKHLLREQLKARKTVIKSTIIKLVTGFACSIHLFLCLCSYLQYPTFTDSDYLRDNSTNYELSVCNSYIEERSSHLFADYESNQITRSQLDREMDRILSEPVNRVISERPADNLHPVGCWARGLAQSTNLTDHMQDIADRLLFADDGEASYCKAVFKSKLFLINGLICHRFIQKDLKLLDGRGELSYATILFRVSVDHRHLTHTFSVMIGKNDVKPFYSSFWSPLVFKPKQGAYFLVSFIKYHQKILGHPYDQGLTSAITLRCIYGCISDALDKLNLAHGFANSNQSNRFISKSEINQTNTQISLKTTYERCRWLCKHYTYTEKARSYFVTQISRPEVDPKKIDNRRVSFTVMKTEYPVISLVMKAQWSFVELIISLGSVLNIWFGFCALSLDPKTSDSSLVDQQCLQQCERQIYNLQSLPNLN